MRQRRRVDADHPPCRECVEPFELDQERVQRLGERSFIECGLCRNLIRIRRSDERNAVRLGASGSA
jgi:hypothetical protein